MAFCIQCGNQIKDGARFCPKCGAKQGDDTEESTKSTSSENSEEQLYDVIIEKIEDPNTKMAVLKEIRSTMETDISSAKRTIDNGGYVGFELSKDEAEKMKKRYEELGATVSIEVSKKDESEQLYDVFIEEVDEVRKMEVLRELCAVGGFNLAEAGDIIENAGYIKEGVSKEEAEQLKNRFELLGATVSIEEAQENLYDVFLEKIDPEHKDEVVEFLSNIPDMTEEDVKDIIENSGYVVEGVPRADAETVKAILEGYGAEVSIEESEDDDDDDSEEDDDSEDDDSEDETDEEADGVFSASQQPSHEENKSSDSGSTCLGCGIMIAVAYGLYKLIL
ncbi:MAG: ribosomal protein L7/L12 [Fibrobacter sp.]|nr:ribosomal protein L7/L12 [Fibrobacter sp.]